MTRITHAEHYRRYRFIRMLFQEPGLQVLFTLLDLPKQYELHDFYATTRDFDEAAFDAYRNVKAMASPSLANRTGKSFRAVEQAFIEASRAHGMTRQQMKQAIATHNSRKGVAPRSSPPAPQCGRLAPSTAKVLPVGRPLDERQLAKTLLFLARHMQSNNFTLNEMTPLQSAASLSSDPSRTSSRAG